MKKVLFFVFLLFFANVIFSQSVALDPAFGEDGITLVPNFEEILLFDLDKSGNIIAAGQSFGDTVGFLPLTLVKTNVNGVIDKNFGTNGIVKVMEFRKGNPIALKITNNNKIFVVCNFDNTLTDYRTTMIQFNADGSFDDSFGENGKISIGFKSEPVVNIESSDFILISDNFVHSTISKYNYLGEIDESFGKNGKVTMTDSVTYNIRPLCIKILRDQSIIVAGFDALNKCDTEIACCKLDANGNFITDFANNGIWKKNMCVDYDLFYETFCDVIEESNGDIVFTGKEFGAFICKLNSDGVLYQNFGVDGFFYNYDFNGDKPKILPFEKKYFAGIMFGSYYGSYFLFSINQDGTLDTSFNNTGFFILDNIHVSDIKLQEANKIILGGDSKILRLNISTGNSIRDNEVFFDTQFIFPNPTKDNLYFKNKTKYEILDIQGRVLQKSENAEKSANISQIKAGIYFIKFDNNKVKKFVKE